MCCFLDSKHFKINYLDATRKTCRGKKSCKSLVSNHCQFTSNGLFSTKFPLELQWRTERKRGNFVLKHCNFKGSPLDLSKSDSWTLEFHKLLKTQGREGIFHCEEGEWSQDSKNIFNAHKGTWLLFLERLEKWWSFPLKKTTFRETVVRKSLVETTRGQSQDSSQKFDDLGLDKIKKDLTLDLDFNTKDWRLHLDLSLSTWKYLISSPKFKD